MKKKKIHFIFIILSLFLIVSCISLNMNTVSYAKDRIITEINNSPIILEDNKIEENGITEESILEEKTNSYNNKELFIIIITSLVVIVCTINLIITKLGTTTFQEALHSNKRLIYYSLLLVFLCTSISIYNVIYTDKNILNGIETKSRNEKSIAIIEITENKKVNKLKEESNKIDTSVIQVSNQATYNATNLEILKSSGETTDKDSSTYYGLNSAVIFKDGSSSEIKDSIIVTGANYSTALFANGSNTTVDLKNVRLTTMMNNSNGISVSESAKMTATDIEIKTHGNDSPSIKTISNASELIVNDSKFQTNGEKSPLIYNTGKITANNIEGISTKSNIITMNSINNLIINESDLTTKLNSSEENLSAIFLYTDIDRYDRMNYSNSSLTIENSKLRISKDSPVYKTAPLFKITNIDANINLSNTEIEYGSNILFEITKNDTYGEIGDNGGRVIFTSTDQKLKGDIIVDETSSIYINLNNTYYKGMVNNENKSEGINVVLDKTSTWELTGDSYINTLTIQNGKISRLRNQIKSNGHNIYYNAYQNDWLESKIIRLPGGGKLIPIFES